MSVVLEMLLKQVDAALGGMGECGPVSVGGMVGINALRGLFQSFSDSGGDLLLSAACSSAGCKIIIKKYAFFSAEA